MNANILDKLFLIQINECKNKIVDIKEKLIKIVNEKLRYNFKKSSQNFPEYRNNYLFICSLKSIEKSKIIHTIDKMCSFNRT